MQPWKRAEKDFEASFDQYGKDAHVARLADTAAAKATGGKTAIMAAQPSDYVVTLKGTVFFAEVKTTSDETTFHFSNIRKGQWNASRRITVAGGQYMFFIKSLHHSQWYCVPAEVFHTNPTKSMRWTQLKDYACEI